MSEQKANVTFGEILSAIKRAKHVLISGHVRPDGDALGSMIALSHILRGAGVDAAAVVESRNGLGGPGFLRGVEELLTPSEIKGREFDLFISLDCGSFERLPGELQPVAAAIAHSVNIDHHFTNTRFCEFNRVEGNASSTGEVVWRLVKCAKWPLDSVSAEALWVAVITDSGRFAYDQTNPVTLRCGADLLKHGVRTAFINDKLYCSFPQKSIELKRRAFQTLEYSPDGSIAAITLTGKDFAETGGCKADAEDAIEIPRSIVGNRVALFFYGDTDSEGETRISIRTREPFDASALARQFDGGGHIRAAGCTIHKPLAEAKAIFMDALRAWMKSSEGTNK